MPKIPEEEINRIKRETDLVALIRSRGIELTKHGSKDFIGLCPFHEDKKTPNLIVSPAKGLWHCMSCGAAGNPIQFVEKFDGISFRHAFVLLNEGKALETTEQHKISTVPRLESPLDPDADDEALTKQVIQYYHERLLTPDGSKARDYLAKRGLADEKLIEKFHLGYADRTLGLRLPDKNRRSGAAIRDRLTKLGFYRESGHEHLNGSLIVPIFTPAGKVGEVYGRKVTGKLRKGTPDHLYLPGPHRGIFNPDAFSNREIILCESLIDALTFWQNGMESVTTIFGTEGFTDELFEAIRIHKVESIRIAYDADDAGDRAAERDVAKLTAIGVECYRIRFPWGEDVNSFAQNVGTEALKRAVRQAEWLGAGPAKPFTVAPSFLAASNSLAADSGEGKAAKKKKPELVRAGDHWNFNLDGRVYRVGGLDRNAGLDSLKITLRIWWDDLFHLDSLDLCNDSHRRKFIERASEECRLENALVKRDLGKLLLAIEQHQEQRLREEDSTTTQVAPEMTPTERSEAEQLLQSPDLITRIGQDFEACGMVGEEVNRIVGYLACTSRLLRRPLAVIIQSTSAAGKSTLMEAVLTLFPEEERIKYSAMTGQSLYYLGETNLKHKILAIVEEEGAERASYALKLLQSEGELTIASTGKNPKTGQMETQTYHVEGPVMIFLTTTAIDIDEELQNRCLTLSVDETRAQTERIHSAQRKARTESGIIDQERKTSTLRAHRNAQRLLKSYPVCNPFVEQLTFTADRTRTRRDHEKYLSLIDAVALLHQRQRKVEVRILPDGTKLEILIAQLEDIAIANRIAPEVLGRSLDELPPQTRSLLESIKLLIRERMEKLDLLQDKTYFTRREIREATGWSYMQIKRHIERLTELEYLATRHGRNGSAFQYELLVSASEPRGTWQVGLLGIEQLRVEKHGYDNNLNGAEGDLTTTSPVNLVSFKQQPECSLSESLPPFANAHQGEKSEAQS